MTLVHHNYKNLNSLFDEFYNNFSVKNNGWNMPLANIHETQEAYHLELAAPGVKKEDFKVNLEKGLLTISYEKKREEEVNDKKTHRKEFSFSSFKRSFSVDDQINAEKIEAKYENGVLNLVLPKKEEVKILPKAIAIA